MATDHSPRRRPHVVVIGAGFGGLAAARALRDAPVDVTLLDRTNHHLFQPLLYQVATATLPSTDITAPVRWLVRKHANTRVLMAEVKEIDAARRVVLVDAERRAIPYDALVVAAGARHSYFGHDEWEEVAPGLKSIDDAEEMRRKFLTAFEEAEKTEDPHEREAWLTFVIVGAGPTGVELAGILPTIARRAFPRDFRAIDTRQARVILVEGGPRLLTAFPEDLAARAWRDLEELGVEVRTGAVVTHIDKDGVTIGRAGTERSEREVIRARTVLWAAGNAASGLGAGLGAPLDRAGRVQVREDLSVAAHPEVFVVGDMAAVVSEGNPVPGVAPAAMQGGRHAARNVLRRLRGEPTLPFRYVNKGDLATIGRLKAIARFGSLKVAGFPAWFLWLFVHVLYLASFRNRISVLLEWAYAFVTYQRGSRLITEPKRHNPAPSDARASVGWR